MSKYVKTLSFIKERKEHLGAVLKDLTGDKTQGISEREKNVNVNRFKNHLNEWLELEKQLAGDFEQSDIVKLANVTLVATRDYIAKEKKEIEMVAASDKKTRNLSAETNKFMVNQLDAKAKRIALINACLKELNINK